MLKGQAGASAPDWVVSCQSQSGVSLSLHLGSKMKIYLCPQEQLDMEEYRI